MINAPLQEQAGMPSAIHLPLRRYTVFDSIAIAFRCAPIAAFFYGFFDLAWAALTPVSDRCVYAGVAELSVYVAATAQGKGVGRALLVRLIDDSERAGIWTLQSTILAENAISIALDR